MAFLDHIRLCNSFDLARYRPFKIARRTLGWVRDDFVTMLAGRPDLFMVQPHAVVLAPALADAAQRSAAVDAFLRDLRTQGMFKAWREERYPVSASFGEEPAMEMERAAVAAFGIRAYGVHLTGYVRRHDGLHVWVATRARNKPTYPGMLDNTVAGGQPAGLSLFDNLVKECKEEAGIGEAMARQAKPVGFVTYCMEQHDGLKPDILYNFDLELPGDFVPRNTDGELEKFELWPVAAVMEKVRDTGAFKFNCNLVLIDFFIRHGLIAADHVDYFELVSGLHSHVRGPDGLTR